MTRGASSGKMVREQNQRKSKNQPADVFMTQVQGLLKELCAGCESAPRTIDSLKHYMNELEDIQKTHRLRTNQQNNQSYLIKERSNSSRQESIGKLFEEISRHPKSNNLELVELIEQFGEFGLKKVATGDKPPATQDVQIPRECMILSNSTSHYESHKDFLSFLDTDKMTKPKCGMMNVRLTLRLLYERVHAEKSPHNQYIQALPTSYHTPLYWSLSDFELLLKAGEGCNEEFEAAFDLFKSCARQYCYFINVISTLTSLRKFYNSFSWDSYRWAVSTVQTRANNVDEEVLGFIPILELANTDETATVGMERLCSTPVVVGPGQSSTDVQLTHACISVKHVADNSPVLISYGKTARSGINLLIHNGICISSRVDYMINLPRFKDLSENKVKFMLQNAGDDINPEADVCPTVLLTSTGDDDTYIHGLKQLIHFLVVAYDKDDEKTEYDFQNPDYLPQAKRYLQIRLLVLQKQIKSCGDLSAFSQECLRTYMETKQSVVARLVALMKDVY